MILLGWKAAVALVALAVSLVGLGACMGVLGTLAWSEHAVARCQELRAESFEATWESTQALNACTCAVTGRCGR